MRTILVPGGYDNCSMTVLHGYSPPCDDESRSRPKRITLMPIHMRVKCLITTRRDTSKLQLKVVAEKFHDIISWRPSFVRIIKTVWGHMLKAQRATNLITFFVNYTVNVSTQQSTHIRDRLDTVIRQHARHTSRPNIRGILKPPHMFLTLLSALKKHDDD